MVNVSMMGRRTNSWITTAGVALFVLMVSLLFAPLHFAGDQIPYTRAYEGISDLSLADAYLAYQSYVGSSEFGHFFVIWLTSNLGIEKNLVMAIFNGLLAFFMMRLLEQWRVSLFVASTICLTNFYFLVLYFSSERLKLGILLFLMSAYYLHNKQKSFALSALALITHIQLIIPYTALLLPKIYSSISLRPLLTFKLRDKYIIVKTLVFLIGVVLIWQLLGSHIAGKYEYYTFAQNEKDNSFRYFQSSLLFGLSFLYTKKYSEVVLKFIPIFIAVYLMGGDNVNLFAYAIFMSYALIYKRGLNFGVLITSLYFGYKSIDFILLTLQRGQGI